jgi:hypothetical protein
MGNSYQLVYKFSRHLSNRFGREAPEFYAHVDHISEKGQRPFDRRRLRWLRKTVVGLSL